MFEHVEEKLKVLAVVNAVCGALCAVTLFFWGVSQGEYSDGLALTGMMLGMVVLLNSLISSWFIYAFAELLENTKEMNHVLKIGFAPEIKKAEQDKAEECKRAEQAEQEKKARIAAYWDSRPEEKRALEARRAEAEEKLKELGGFDSDKRKELEDLIESIDETLNTDGQ